MEISYDIDAGVDVNRASYGDRKQGRILTLPRQAPEVASEEDSLL